MRELRKSPEQMRKDGMEKVHATFERESKLFIVGLLGEGKACAFKAYAYHLWANLPVLFRRYGCLELMNQTAMEAKVGKITRIMPHVQLAPCGRYSLETIRAGVAAVKAEYERRLANLASPAQAITEELLQETLHAEYEHLPAKKAGHKSVWKLRDIMKRVDKDVAEGKVVKHADWVAYWRRFMARQKLLAFMAARRWIKAQADKLQGGFMRKDGLGRELAHHSGPLCAEYSAYYAKHVAPHEASDLQISHAQRMRKADWRRKADKAYVQARGI